MSNNPRRLYRGLIKNYRQTLNRFVGPTNVLVRGNTLQLNDYSKTDWPWTMFNPEDKRRRHETMFPKECETAFKKGVDIAITAQHIVK